MDFISTTKKYLIRRGKRGKPITHIWTGNDTACKMVSCGGINVETKKWVHIDRKIGSICVMCENNMEKIND